MITRTPPPKQPTIPEPAIRPGIPTWLIRAIRRRMQLDYPKPRTGRLASWLIVHRAVARFDAGRWFDHPVTAVLPDGSTALVCSTTNPDLRSAAKFAAVLGLDLIWQRERNGRVRLLFIPSPDAL